MTSVGAGFAVRADVDYERAGGDVDLVGAKQEENIDRAGGRHLGRPAAASPGHEADVQRAHPRRHGMQDRVAVPIFLAAALRGACRERGDGRTIGARQRGHAHDHQRMIGLLEHRAELVRT